MVVLLLGRSGRSVLLVDEYGDTFVTSVEFVRGLLDGRSPRGFVQFKRLGGVRSSKFKPSPVMGDPFSGKVGRSLASGDVVGSVVSDLGDW